MPHPTLPKINSLSELRHKFSSESQNTNHQVVFKISYIIQNNSPTENPVSTLIVHWNAAALNDDNNLNESETQRGKTKIPRGQREAAPIWSRRRTARPSTTTLPAAKTAELCLARNGGPARDRTHAPATREREREEFPEGVEIETLDSRCANGEAVFWGFLASVGGFTRI